MDLTKTYSIRLNDYILPYYNKKCCINKQHISTFIELVYLFIRISSLILHFYIYHILTDYLIRKNFICLYIIIMLDLLFKFIICINQIDKLYFKK